MSAKISLQKRKCLFQNSFSIVVKGNLLCCIMYKCKNMVKIATKGIQNRLLYASRDKKTNSWHTFGHSNLYIVILQDCGIQKPYIN